MTRPTLRSTLIALACAVGLLAAGCGGGDGSSTADTSSSASAGGDQASAAASTTAADGATSDGASSDAPPEPDAVEFPKIVPGSGKGVKIGYISLDESVPFVHLVSDGIKKVAEKTGAQLVFCDAQQDGQKALACARNFKTQGVQGYLNFQSDAKSSPGVCAAGPKVPVIAIDIEQPPCQTSFMGANNEYAGYLGGRAMGDYFKKNFDCDYDAFISMEGPESGAVNEQRMGGFRKGFSEVCGDIHDLKKEAGDRIDSARQVFTDVLTSLPGQHRLIVVSLNDDGIEGALAAAKTANRTDDLYVAGTGADPSAWCQIKNNPHWVADPAFFPERYGEIGVTYLIKAIKGDDVPEHLYVPHKLINGDNIDETYDVSKC